MAGPTKFRRKTLKVSTKERCKWLEAVLIMVILYTTEVNGILDKVSIDQLKAESQTANEGEQVILHCYFTPANADIGKWYWKTNGTAVTRSDQPDPKSRYSLANATEGTGNASLIIKSVTRWDKGKYICGVDDESTTSSVAQSDVCWLTVYYLENPKLEALGEKDVPEGTKVSLKCKLALSYPEVTTINWFHGNKKIKDDNGKYSIEFDILEITQFDKRDVGNYTCRVENTFIKENNGKISNSITLSLLEEITNSMSITWIPVTFFFVVLIIIIFGYVWYRKKHKAKLEKEIYQAVTSFMTNTESELRLERNLLDVELEKNSVKEALEFTNKNLYVARGENIDITFKSTYSPKHTCFQEKLGFSDPFFCIDLQHFRGEQKNVGLLLYTSKDIKKDNSKYCSKFGSNEFGWEVKKIKNGTRGDIRFTEISDDDEGQYVCKLKIRSELLKPGGESKTNFTFYGKTSIQLTNIIFRNLKENMQFRPVKLIPSDIFYLLVEDKINAQYIMCRGKCGKEECGDARDIHQQPHKNLDWFSVSWDVNANVLMNSNEKIKFLSFAVLPGIRHPYIVLGLMCHGKNILQKTLVAIFPKSQQNRVIPDVIETMQSDGHILDLKFDNLSGIKLSTGRIVVGGWIKRLIADKNHRCIRWKIECLESSPTANNLMDIENQSYEYESFIIYTDDEIHWNLSLNVKMDNAEDNMRFQITETCPSTIHVIISSLSSNQILYEGTSNDNCQSFTKNTDQCSEVPLVSFALSPERLFLCAPSFTKTKYTSDNEVSFGTTDCGEVRSKYQSIMEEATAGQSMQNTDEPSREQETEDKDINEKSSLIKDVASSETKYENSKTNEAPLDLYTPPENSSDGISDNVKKRDNVKKATSKFSFSAIRKKKSKNKPGNNYVAVPTSEEDNEEKTKRDGKNNLSETQGQDNEITPESERRPKSSLEQTESEEKNEQKVEIVKSDLETQPQERSEPSLENLKKRSTLKKATDKFTKTFQKKKKDEKEPVSEECIMEEPNVTENGQKSEETERKDKIVTSDFDSQPRTSIKTSKNSKKRKGKPENQSSKADEQVPANDDDDDVNKLENQTIDEGSLEQNAEDKIDAMSSSYMTSDRTEGSSKKSRSSIGNVLAITWRLMPKLKYSTSSKPDESVMVLKPELSNEKKERELGGLWHLIQDRTDKTAIRVRPIRDGDPSDFGQVTILKNRSRVKCGQIVPFTHEGRSLFLMIYSTDFHKEGDVSTWRSTRYHVFSVADLFK